MIAKATHPRSRAYRESGSRERIRCNSRASAVEPLRRPRQENVNGAFFVDHTCIDCDTCRWMSPGVFTREGSMSAVTKQPKNDTERKASIQALLSCPTSSIHVNSTKKGELKAIQESFPIPIPTSRDLFFCGFTDEKSFAACSYFIKSQNGNVLVDCPRFNPALVKRFDALGGIRYIVLSHIDDVGDHAKWAKHYDAIRILHREEVEAGTKDCEIQLEGTGPWAVGEDGDLDEMEILHTPDRCLPVSWQFYQNDKAISIGCYNRLDHSISVQSLKKLLDYDFVNVYPGHGRRVEFENTEDKDAQINAYLSQL